MRAPCIRYYLCLSSPIAERYSLSKLKRGDENGQVFASRRHTRRRIIEFSRSRIISICLWQFFINSSSHSTLQRCLFRTLQIACVHVCIYRWGWVYKCISVWIVCVIAACVGLGEEFHLHAAHWGMRFRSRSLRKLKLPGLKII